MMADLLLFERLDHMRSLPNKTPQRNRWFFISMHFLQCLRTLLNDRKFLEYSLFLGRKKKLENKKCKIRDKRYQNVQRYHPHF